MRMSDLVRVYTSIDEYACACVHVEAADVHFSRAEAY